MESVLADPALLARTVAGARAAPRRGYGPELSDHANVTLAALLEALETADPLRIQRSLRHCATCESAWTVLRCFLSCYGMICLLAWITCFAGLGYH